MQTCTNLLEEAPATVTEPQKALDVVVLYDSLAAGKRSLAALARIAGIKQDGIVEISPHPWRFDILEDPAEFQNAERDTRAAGMIIVASNGEQPLPMVVKVWLATVLARRKGAGISVAALLGKDRESATAFSHDRELIKEMTVAAGLDFFASCFDAPFQPEASR